MTKAKGRLDARLQHLQSAAFEVPGFPDRTAAAACLKAAFSAIGGPHFFESAFGRLTTEGACSLCAAGQEGEFLAAFFSTIGGEETPVFADVVKALAHHIDGLREEVAVVAKTASSLDVKHPGTGLVGIRTTKACNKGWGSSGEDGFGLTTQEKAVVTGVATRALLALVLAPTDRLFWERARGDRSFWEQMSWEQFALRELGPVLLTVCALTLSADFNGVRPRGLSPKVSWLALVPWIYVGGNVGPLKTLPLVGAEFEIPAEYQDDDAGSFGLNAKTWHLFPKIYASNSKKEYKVCAPACLYKNNPVCCQGLYKSAATGQATPTACLASAVLDMTPILMTTIATLNDEIARLKRENEHLRQRAAETAGDGEDDSSEDAGT
jgi:hypothetical protein